MWNLAYKKAKCRRIDAFELWCWKRLLRVPLTAKRSNQSVLKDISPEYSLERLTDTEAPKFWPPDAKNWLIWKDPDAGKNWRQEKGMTEDEMVGWHHQLNGHEFEQAPELVMDREAWYAVAYGVTKSWTWLSDWTELNWKESFTHFSFLVCACSVTHLFSTLCKPWDCSPPDSPVRGISQARVLEWVVISYSGGSSRPRDRTRVSCDSCIGRRILTTQEAVLVKEMENLQKGDKGREAFWNHKTLI